MWGNWKRMVFYFVLKGVLIFICVVWVDFIGFCCNDEFECWVNIWRIGVGFYSEFNILIFYVDCNCNSEDNLKN